ncbi:MAG: carbohydrate kinase [Acidobacteria bacterium]|nr:carbohydrate kinase [Acidobacteriota bacterium]
MSRRNPFELKTRRPSVVGTGLIALDVVIEEKTKREPWLWTGGTCGNVLAILSYLGWEAFPVARLNGDAASRCVEEDLSRWGVRLDHAKTNPGARTPIVVHRITKTSAGLPSHRFSWTCPNCGAWLPGYQPVRASAAERIIPHLRTPKVFFLDRVSRGALELARACIAKGALVFFEPAGFGEPRLFKEALVLAHILKYSHERIRSFQGMGEGKGPLLEIETLGAEGLRYRSRITGASTDGWERLEAFEVIELRDAAGAGDWCTAGIIHRLGQRGLGGLMKASHFQLADALRFGQALAAWNCRYSGARGGMYAVEKEKFQLQVKSVISSNGSKALCREVPTAVVRQTFECICPGCAAMTEEATAVRPR